MLSIFVSKFSKFELVTIILVSSAYKRILGPEDAKFGKLEKSNGPKIDPRGNPCLNFSQVDSMPLL